MKQKAPGVASVVEGKQEARAREGGEAGRMGRTRGERGGVPGLSWKMPPKEELV